MKKLLKDFPLNAWMDAANGCEYCGRRYAVKVVEVDESGCFGWIEYELHHKPDCLKVLEGETDEDGVERGEDSAGWTYMDEPHVFKGKTYWPLKSRANVGPCLECGKLVIGVPLILFLDEGRKGELDFCFECADKLGILRSLK